MIKRNVLLVPTSVPSPALGLVRSCGVPSSLLQTCEPVLWLGASRGSQARGGGMTHHPVLEDMPAPALRSRIIGCSHPPRSEPEAELGGGRHRHRRGWGPAPGLEPSPAAPDDSAKVKADLTPSLPHSLALSFSRSLALSLSRT